MSRFRLAIAPVATNLSYASATDIVATPNVEGNRRADEMVTEDQAAYRRVRLTVRLGRG